MSKLAQGLAAEMISFGPLENLLVIISKEKPGKDLKKTFMPLKMCRLGCGVGWSSVAECCHVGRPGSPQSSREEDKEKCRLKVGHSHAGWPPFWLQSHMANHCLGTGPWRK